jgi:hypothetical protein
MRSKQTDSKQVLKGGVHGAKHKTCGHEGRSNFAQRGEGGDIQQTELTMCAVINGEKLICESSVLPPGLALAG